MEHDNSAGSKTLGRRRTLQLIGVSGLAAATGLLGLACKKEEGGAPGGGTAGGGCNTAVDEQSKTMRKTLQYKEVGDAAKQCKACAQYNDKAFAECGGCKLFTGPVKPEGSCLSFAPKAG